MPRENRYLTVEQAQDFQSRTANIVKDIKRQGYSSDVARKKAWNQLAANGAIYAQYYQEYRDLLKEANPKGKAEGGKIKPGFAANMSDNAHKGQALAIRMGYIIADVYGLKDFGRGRGVKKTISGNGKYVEEKPAEQPAEEKAEPLVDTNSKYAWMRYNTAIELYGQVPPDSVASCLLGISLEEALQMRQKLIEKKYEFIWTGDGYQVVKPKVDPLEQRLKEMLNVVDGFGKEIRQLLGEKE